MTNSTESNETNKIAPSVLHMPAVPLDSAEFEIHHYGLSKGEYQQTLKRRFESKIKKNPHLYMVERIKPNTDLFLHYLKLVGENYGWNLRKEFQDAANRPYLGAMLAQKTSHMYLFKCETDTVNEIGEREAETVGFCEVTSVPAIQGAVNAPTSNINSADPAEAVERFKVTARQESDAKAVEISKIGLLPKYTNQGMGHIYLAHVLDQIFEVQHANIAYLNTRNTNHRGIENFYTENGFILFHSEKIANDLIVDTSGQPFISTSTPPPPTPPALGLS